MSGPVITTVACRSARVIGPLEAGHAEWRGSNTHCTSVRVRARPSESRTRALSPRARAAASAAAMSPAPVPVPWNRPSTSMRVSSTSVSRGSGTGSWAASSQKYPIGAPPGCASASPRAAEGRRSHSA
jgi:hypothetical protein